MSISMSSASLPVFIRMLSNARTWLDKAAVDAETRHYDPSVLIASRLAPDMFAFARQLQIATDGAKGCVARLAGVDIPAFADTESTLPELQARLDKTLDFIRSIDAAKIDGTEDKEIVLKSPRGDRTFRGEDYLKHYVLPNFYFHLTTAYAILRHNGVNLGKTDFLAGAG